MKYSLRKQLDDLIARLQLSEGETIKITTSGPRTAASLRRSIYRRLRAEGLSATIAQDGAILEVRPPREPIILSLEAE